MLKQMIQWEGFDGQPAVRTLYFNLTRYEIAHDMELEKLEARFRNFQEEVVGNDENDVRQMTPPEIREMLDIFKTLIKHAYGIRSENGKRFSKNEEIWNEFVETGAFDAFIFYMFEDANRANAFMQGIWPKEIQEAAAKVRSERPDLHPVPDLDTQDGTDDGVPSIDAAPGEKPWSDYSKQELLDLSTEDYEALVARSKNGNNVPFPLLQIGMERNSRSD